LQTKYNGQILEISGEFQSYYSERALLLSSNIKIILKHSNLLFNLIPNIIELIHIYFIWLIWLKISKTDMNNMGKVCEKIRQGLPVEAGALYAVLLTVYRYRT
jgi:hypothetical protein